MQDSLGIDRVMELNLQKETKPLTWSIQRNFILYLKHEGENNRSKVGDEKRKKISSNLVNQSFSLNYLRKIIIFSNFKLPNLWSKRKRKNFKELSYHLNGRPGCCQLDCSSCPKRPLKKQSIRLATITIYRLLMTHTIAIVICLKKLG